MLPKILIVEDDAVIRELYALKFEMEGYPVKAVENGQEAMVAVVDFDPHFILLDMMMPVMDGLEFMEQFHAMAHPAEVVIFSNVSTSPQRQAVMKLGARDYWVKSDFTPEQVVNRVQQWWQERPSSEKSCR